MLLRVLMFSVNSSAFIFVKFPSLKILLSIVCVASYALVSDARHIDMN